MLTAIRTDHCVTRMLWIKNTAKAWRGGKVGYKDQRQEEVSGYLVTFRIICLERRQVDGAVLAGQSSYFSMVWLHAVAGPSRLRAIAWSHCVERDKYILDVNDALNAVC